MHDFSPAFTLLRFIISPVSFTAAVAVSRLAFAYAYAAFYQRRRFCMPRSRFTLVYGIDTRLLPLSPRDIADARARDAST